MAKTKLGEFKVGLFVFIAALVVLLTIFWAKGFTVNLKMLEYTVYFPKVSGLNEGDMVVTSGQLKLKNNDRVVINNTVTPSDQSAPQTPNER